MQNILEIDSVIKSYGRRQVLTDIYLKCQTGDIIGILGRNGCGKSTLLKVIFGIVDGGSSCVRIDGTKYPEPYKTGKLVGYLPQHDFLPEHLSVYKVAALYLDTNAIASFFDDEMIGDLQQSKIGDLSGGELRYLEIKLMLNASYKFLLLDEPFNGVAPIVIERLKIMIFEHSKTKGIILTDHDYNNVLDVANRCCLLYDGSIKHIETKQDLVRWNYLTENSLQ